MKIWPGIKILDRYIIRKFIGTYLFAIAMIIVVVVLFDYVEKLDDFTEMKAPVQAIIFDYYLNFVPFFINQFSGLFTFIACIFFTSKMAYQTEIVAMLSGGMSFRRLMWPYFVSALLIASLSLTLNLWVIPVSQRAQVAFEMKYIKKRVREHATVNRHIYRQIEPGVFAYIRGYSAASSQASYLALEHFRNNEMTASLEAADLKIDPATKRWTASRYITREFDSLGMERFEQRRDLDTLINLDVTELGRINDEDRRVEPLSRTAAAEGIGLDPHHRGGATRAVRLPDFDLHPDAHRRFALVAQGARRHGTAHRIGRGALFFLHPADALLRGVRQERHAPDGAVDVDSQYPLLFYRHLPL